MAGQKHTPTFPSKRSRPQNLCIFVSLRERAHACAIQVMEHFARLWRVYRDPMLLPSDLAQAIAALQSEGGRLLVCHTALFLLYVLLKYGPWREAFCAAATAHGLTGNQDASEPVLRPKLLALILRETALRMNRVPLGSWGTNAGRNTSHHMGGAMAMRRLGVVSFSSSGRLQLGCTTWRLEPMENIIPAASDVLWAGRQLHPIQFRLPRDALGWEECAGYIADTLKESKVAGGNYVPLWVARVLLLPGAQVFIRVCECACVYMYRRMCVCVCGSSKCWPSACMRACVSVAPVCACEKTFLAAACVCVCVGPPLLAQVVDARPWHRAHCRDQDRRPAIRGTLGTIRGCHTPRKICAGPGAAPLPRGEALPVRLSPWCLPLFTIQRPARAALDVVVPLCGQGHLQPQNFARIPQPPRCAARVQLTCLCG